MTFMLKMKPSTPCSDTQPRCPGINYFRRIRCVTVGTAQITPPLPNKKPALLGSAFLFGNAQGLNLRAARDQLLVLFVDPGFFKEVRAVRV